MKLTKNIARDLPYIGGYIFWEVLVLLLSGTGHSMEYTPLIYLVEVLYFYCVAAYVLPLRTNGLKQRLIKVSWIVLSVILLAGSRLAFYAVIANSGNAMLVFSSMPLIMTMLYRAVMILCYAGAYWLGKDRSNNAQRLKQEVLELENKRVMQENTNLLAQINRHTQLNAYNKLYSLVTHMPDSERAAKLVLALSEQEQLSLQEIDEQGKIFLSHEIAMLENMIQLERVSAEHPVYIELEIETADRTNGLRIPPKMLVPLLENIFKHGITDEKEFPAQIFLCVEGDELKLETKNGKLPERDLPSYNIGLVNVKNRLQNFYPGRHDLQIIETDETFFLMLKITL